MVPSWANEIMIAKGIGFESEDVKDVIWTYFESQFSEFECGQNQLEMYFAHMVGKLIKNGDVDKARKHFADISRMEALQPPQPKARPIRRSQLATFDEKANRFLARFDNGVGADLEGLNLFELTNKENDQ